MCELKVCTRWGTCPPDVKGFNGEDVGASRLKVVPEVVVGNRQYHLGGVALLSVQLDKHPGVRAGPVHTARLDCNVVADIFEGDGTISPKPKHWKLPCSVSLMRLLKRRRPSPAGTNSRTICPSSSLRSNHLEDNTLMMTSAILQQQPLFRNKAVTLNLNEQKQKRVSKQKKNVWRNSISFGLENVRVKETQRCKQHEYLNAWHLFHPFTSQTGETSLFPGETLHFGRVVWLRLPPKRASSPLRLLLLICSSKLIQQLPNDLNTHRWSIVQRKHGQLRRIFLGRLEYFFLKFLASQEQLSKVQFNNKDWPRI